MSDIPECPVCFDKYGGTVVPQLMICCQNHICLNCAENDRSVKVSNLTRNRKKINCMFCNKLYHSQNETPWILDRLSIELMGITVGLRAESTNERSTSNPISLQAQSHQGSPQRVTRSYGSNLARTDGNREEVALSTVQERVGLELERPTAATQHQQSHQSSFSEFQRYTNVERSASRARGSYVTIEGLTEIVDSQRARMTDDCFKNAHHMFRIRQFTRAARRPGIDQFGRGPSMWCLQNNYCASSDRVLASNYITDPKECLRFLLETNKDVIAASCIGKPLFQGDDHRIKIYTKSYIRFASMEKGDIVAMIVPGPSHQSEVYFGVIVSNDLKLMTPDEAEEAQFPAMHLLREGEMELRRFRGLMLREVKWLRKGLMRDLPGQKRSNYSTPRRNDSYTVPWLDESIPFWFQDISKHLNMIKTNSFFETTTPMI